MANLFAVSNPKSAENLAALRAHKAALAVAANARWKTFTNWIVAATKVSRRRNRDVDPLKGVL